MALRSWVWFINMRVTSQICVTSNDVLEAQFAMIEAGAHRPRGFHLEGRLPVTSGHQTGLVPARQGKADKEEIRSWLTPA